jgi:hypothetical protein
MRMTGTKYWDLGFAFFSHRSPFVIASTLSAGVHAACSMGRLPGGIGVASRGPGPWVLGANMRSILIVALAFKVLHHLVQIAATRRT